MADPKRWSLKELTKEAATATHLFRSGRTGEPQLYSQFFDAFAPIFRDLIDKSLPELIKETIDADLIADIVSDQDSRTAYRYLAAPPISDDDLKTLAETKLSPAKLRTDSIEARRVREAVLNAIDPHRFPWVMQKRKPTNVERKIAIIASAVLVATQKVGTSRRSSAKNIQESAVKNLLADMKFAAIPARKIRLLEDGPQPGQYCGESQLGDTRADLVVRLPDRRYLAIECKVSNSKVNSFKRVNHEALGKARRWVGQFGSSAVVPAAVLSGVFEPKNLSAAQTNGLYLFWGHRLDDLRRFIRSSH